MYAQDGSLPAHRTRTFLICVSGGSLAGLHPLGASSHSPGMTTSAAPDAIRSADSATARRSDEQNRMDHEPPHGNTMEYSVGRFSLTGSETVAVTGVLLGIWMFFRG